MDSGLIKKSLSENPNVDTSSVKEAFNKDKGMSLSVVV